jgi:dihydrodipicolinate reductase
LIEAIIKTRCFTKEEIDILVNYTSPIIIDGDDSIDKFMGHVFGTTGNYSTSSSSSSTYKMEYIGTVVLAHNFRGYDGKFA